ncbi:hypothetical protein NGRA_2187 [Nosema granulosis]|uniref:Uncharacterized protein n=1 Tax=Nosema granulosis TaxID=83296 RepID=A0A9P6GZU0_9MICR|nr:hypothetical protein NGRA_2187 [Nosema granulosis]
MSNIDLFLSRQKLNVFDYSIKLEAETFFKDLLVLLIFSNARPEKSDDVIVSKKEILEKNILADDGLAYLEPKEGYFNLTKAKDKKLIDDIVYFVIQEYICDIVDYIDSSKSTSKTLVSGMEKDKDLIVNVEYLKKIDLTTFKEDFKQVLEYENGSSIDGFDFLKVKVSNGLCYDDGDSSCTDCYSLEDKNIKAVWILKKWIYTILHGYDTD